MLAARSLDARDIKMYYSEKPANYLTLLGCDVLGSVSSLEIFPPGVGLPRGCEGLTPRGKRIECGRGAGETGDWR